MPYAFLIGSGCSGVEEASEEEIDGGDSPLVSNEDGIEMGSDDSKETTASEPSSPYIFSGECDFETFEPGEECGGNCPLTLDAKILCDARDFSSPGLRVAPGADATYLATTSDDFGWVIEAKDSGSFQVHELSDDFDRCTLNLALDPKGQPKIACSTPSGLQLLSKNSGGFRTDIIPTQDLRRRYLYNMEVDSGGVAHFWLNSDVQNEHVEILYDQNGKREERHAPLPGMSGWQRFTITSSGEPIGFDFSPDTDEIRAPWFLKSLYQDEVLKMSSGLGSIYPGIPVVVSSPTLPSMEDSKQKEKPEYFTFLQTESGLRLTWIEDHGLRELGIERTSLPDLKCHGVRPEDSECPEICEEQAVGVQRNMLGLARTEDGRIWGSWAVTHYDQSSTYGYSPPADDGGAPGCDRTIVRDETWSEIILAKLDLQQLDTEVVLRVRDLEPVESFIHPGEDREIARAFDMRAYENDLAIGMRCRDEIGSHFKCVRLLRVDTQQIE